MRAGIALAARPLLFVLRLFYVLYAWISQGRGWAIRPL